MISSRPSPVKTPLRKIFVTKPRFFIVSKLNMYFAHFFKGHGFFASKNYKLVRLFHGRLNPLLSYSELWVHISILTFSFLSTVFGPCHSTVVTNAFDFTARNRIDASVFTSCKPFFNFKFPKHFLLISQVFNFFRFIFVHFYFLEIFQCTLCKGNIIIFLALENQA